MEEDGTAVSTKPGGGGGDAVELTKDRPCSECSAVRDLLRDQSVEYQRREKLLLARISGLDDQLVALTSLVRDVLDQVSAVGKPDSKNKRKKKKKSPSLPGGEDLAIAQSTTESLSRTLPCNRLPASSPPTARAEESEGAFDWASSRFGRLCEEEKSIRTLLQFA